MGYGDETESAKTAGAASVHRTRVTADTNVFYYLGSGTVQKEHFVSTDEELCATPVNVLEIVAGISEREWSQRRDAARGIVRYADRMSLDPEQHLVALMERRTSTLARKEDSLWFQGAKALGDATTEVELLRGVNDFVDLVVRRVNPSVAAATKLEHYDGFKSEIIDVCESLLPGYRSAVLEGTQAPIVEKESRKGMREFLSSPQFVAAVFFAGLVARHRLCTGNTPDLQAATTMDALRDLAPYCSVYGAYLRELLTARRKPDANDWGDLELFMFLQPDTFVATAEKKWWAIAKEAGLGHRVRQIRSI